MVKINHGQRKDKIKLLSALLSGSKSLRDVGETVFKCYHTYASEPGIYYDENNNRLTQEEKDRELSEGRYSSILFEEIKTYE